MKNTNQSSAKALMVMAIEALNAIKQLAELERAELERSNVVPIKATPQVKPIAKITNPKIVEQVDKVRRTRKSKNNRVEILNEVFEKYGFDADPTLLFSEVNKKSVVAGLTPIKMSSFYVMMNTAKRWKRETEGT